MSALRSSSAPASTANKVCTPPSAPTILDLHELTLVSGGLPRVGGWDDTDPPLPDAHVVALEPLPRVG